MPATDASRPFAETSSQPERGSFCTPRQFFGLLLMYFTLQLILRVCISSSLDLDESEQMVLTQKLSWGYGSQPPLYTWLQFGIFKFSGFTVFSLSLLKNILLFCTYLFTFLNARLITRSYACAVAAAASLLFIPQIAWESQRDLTHSVLAATLVCATMFCFLQLREKRTLARYALFGACAGLGVLSKYNFALVLVALAFAAVSIPKFRAITLDWRMALAIVIATLIILPNALWALDHRDLALRSANKFRIQESSHWLSAVISGLKGLLVCSISFFAPLGILYGIIFWKRPATSEPAEKNPYVSLLLRMLLVSYALIILAIVVFRISDVHDRWLQPILISSPLLAIAWLQRRLNATRLKWLVAIAGIVMVLVTIALYGRILWAERMHRTQPWNRPYDTLAQQLKPTLAPVSTVLTDTTLLAGNLRLNLPGKIFTTPELAGIFAPANSSPIALVWDAGGGPAARKSTRSQTRDWPPPDNLAQFAERTGLALNPAQAQYLSATFKYHTTRQMKLGALVVGRDSVEP
jgi:4-amino-4-deoxy-L-arabinose transferase-like glycosyltransferase